MVLYGSLQIALNIVWSGWQWPALLSISIQLLAMYVLFLGLRKYYSRIPFQTLHLFPLIARIVIASFIFTMIWVLFWGGIEYSIFGEKLIKYISSTLRITARIAYSFPLFLGWSALFFGIKAWRDWLNEREQTEHAIEKAQHAQLQMLRYQLNPHFLFNALNSVRALVDEDTRSAKTMITELSEFLRYSLVSRNKPIVTLKDELDAIRLYLSIEQQRYEDKLQVHYEIDEHTEDLPVPSFLIHPLVEDALRDGMQTSTMPLRLEITSTLHDGMMKISVNHSGSHVPINGNGSVESGLEQVEARLKELFPGQFHLSSRQQNNQAQSILELVITNGVNYEEKIASLAH
jgi:two-component system LytT family sensor kinase